MNTIATDRRGHCAKCPPCLETHTEHCPHHATPSPTDELRILRAREKRDRRWSRNLTILTR